MEYLFLPDKVSNKQVLYQTAFLKSISNRIRLASYERGRVK